MIAFNLSRQTTTFGRQLFRPLWRHMSSVENPLAGRKMDFIPGAQNQHVSVDPQGNPTVDLSFIEEPVGLPASEGFGWPQLQFGEKMGPDSRYEIRRKLGWGMNSSSWLAYNHEKKDYVAVKALKGHSTMLSQATLTSESEALNRMLAAPTDHCLRLFDEFTHPGVGSSGFHLCFVTPVYGGDVRSLWRKHLAFPLPLAKRILLHTLRGLAQMHKYNVIHTDLKHDNIFFTTSRSVQDFDALLASDPSRRNPPEASLDGLVTSAVSQPLPIPTLEEAMKCTYLLADFGSAELLGQRKADEITSVALRPPEVFLHYPWNEKVDIWAFGCLIFDFVIGRPLFRHQKFEAQGKVIMDETTCHLYQMACFTGYNEFPAELLQQSRRAAEYSTTGCKFRHNIPVRYEPFEACIRNYKILEVDEDVKSTAAIIERCLQLNPDERPSADELLLDPWFNGVDGPP